MKIIVTTCDKYEHFLKGFVYMFNKHWPFNADVFIVGYSKPSFNLPDNFKFISLGNQEEYGKDWTSALIPFFKQLSDEYFILLLDDNYVLNVNKYLLSAAEKHMENGIDKIYLTNLGNRSGVFEKEIDKNFNLLKQDINFRLSLHPSFIRREYFLKYLIPGKNVWQYETNFKAPKNDGAQILLSKHDIVACSNFAWKGKASNVKQISRVDKEDLDELKRLGVF